MSGRRAPYQFLLPRSASPSNDRRVKRKTLLLLCLCAWINPALGGLEKYSRLIKADFPPVASAPPPSGVRITYLGTNAYLFESNGATLLVDPYFSRQGLFRIALKLRPVLQTQLIAEWLRAHPTIDAVLVTHGHFDHLLDAPQIVRATGAKLIASPTSVKLAESIGVAPGHGEAVRPGAKAEAGKAEIHVLPAQHDRIFGSIPYNGPAEHFPPEKIDHWVTGQPLAFVIEMGGKRIFINAGGPVASTKWRPVDLAIIAVGARDSIDAFPSNVAQLRPRYILPSHQDNFFRPLERGFAFMPLSDFPAVQRAALGAPGELILLDYFRPWTLR